MRFPRRISGLECARATPGQGLEPAGTSVRTEWGWTSVPAPAPPCPALPPPLSPFTDKHVLEGHLASELSLLLNPGDLAGMLTGQGFSAQVAPSAFPGLKARGTVLGHRKSCQPAASPGPGCHGF